MSTATNIEALASRGSETRKAAAKIASETAPLHDDDGFLTHRGYVAFIAGEQADSYHLKAAPVPVIPEE